MEKNHNYDRQTLRFFWQACLLNKRQALLALLYPLGSILVTVGVPLYIGRTIAALTRSPQEAMSYIPYIVVVGLLGIITSRLGVQALFTVQARAMGYLQAQAFQGLMRRSMGFHNNNIGGKLVSDAADYPNAFATLIDSTYNNLVPLILILISGSIVVFSESWQLGLVITVMCIYTITATAWSTYVRSAVRRRRQMLGKQVTGHMADAVVNVPTVKTFAHEQRELQRHNDLNAELTTVRIDDWRVGSGMANTRMAVLMAMQVGFIILLIHSVSNDPSLLDIGIFAFSLITTMSTRLMQLHPVIRQIEDGFLNASPMTEILSQQAEIRDVPNAKRLLVEHGSIDMQDVDFIYADSSQTNQVFTKLSLHIKAGEKIGLVGPSGGGKSTMTRLLLRFEDIEAGSIKIDGQDIAKVTQSSLRQAISYVPQEPLLFHRSVAENIAYGRPEATHDDVIKAAKLAYADDFIHELSDGYDTIVGERGVKLSGGQRQRIAIARAILKDAPILVLDEATSALDSESEVYIQKALRKLMEDRTTLVIAHRLSTIQKMDRIIVLEDGRITEEGTHAQLLKRKGTYAKLWSHQSGGFIED